MISQWFQIINIQTCGLGYSEEGFANGVHLIQNEKWFHRKVSTRVNVSSRTLLAHVVNKSIRNVRHPLTLEIEKEQNLVKLVISSQETVSYRCIMIYWHVLISKFIVRC